MVQTSSNKKPSSDDEQFYQELDEKRSHGSCCTCQTFIILFLVVLFLTLGGISYLYFEIKKGGLFTNSAKFSSKNIQSQLDNVQVDKNNQFKLVLSPDDLNSFFSQGISTQGFIIKDTRVSIDPNEILIYGNLIKPMSAKLGMSNTKETTKTKNPKAIFPCFVQMA